MLMKAASWGHRQPGLANCLQASQSHSIHKWSRLPLPHGRLAGTPCTGEQGGALCPPQGCSDPLPSTARSPPSLPVKHSPHQTRPPLLGPSPLPAISPKHSDNPDCSPFLGEQKFMCSVPLTGQHWLPCYSRIPGQGWGPNSTGRDLHAETPASQGRRRPGSYLPGESLQLAQVNRRRAGCPGRK